MDKTRARAVRPKGKPAPPQPPERLEKVGNKPDLPDNSHVRGEHAKKRGTPDGEAQPQATRSTGKGAGASTTSTTTTTTTTTTATTPTALTTTTSTTSSGNSSNACVTASDSTRLTDAQIEDIFSDWKTRILANCPDEKLSGPYPLLEAILHDARVRSSKKFPDAAFKRLAPDQLLDWYKKALRDPCLDLDHPEEIPLYLLHRLLGEEHEAAVKAAEYGPIWLTFKNNEDREKYLDDLKDCGISSSALTFPRQNLEVEKHNIKFLGEGSSNKVKRVIIDGKKFAFKPASPDCSPSRAAEFAGIEDEEYFSFASHLITRAIAQAVTPEGTDHCVVDFAEVVQLNGELGLLMELAQGTNRKLGTHLYKHKIAADDPSTEGQYLYQQCVRHEKALSDPTQYAALCKVLGLTGIRWKGDILEITGPGTNKTNRFDADLLKNPVFLERMYLLQLVADLAGYCDPHTGNIFLEISPDGKRISLVFIDLDDALAVRTFEEMRAAAQADPGKQHCLYFLTPPIKYISRPAKEAVYSSDFEKKLRITFRRATGHLPQVRLDAVKARIQARKDAIAKGEIKIIESINDWLHVDHGGPLDSFVGRLMAIGTRKTTRKALKQKTNQS